VLAPGQHVGIESLTLLFTDLRDSTQFYERVGDASAYGCVRRHFDFLGRYIADNNGSIVKTIGDAVMAAFYTPEDAVRAAVQIQTHVAEFNAALADDDGIVIKLGLHHGPAVAVNSNNRLDYFGRTVNIAARIGAVSKGNDLVLSANCYERPTVQEILTEHKSQIENFQSALKGIEEVFNLYRVQFHGSAEE
jgi:class 3 adenylate cyclase